MTLPDYPRGTINWDTGLAPDMLRALGNLAVAAAQVEELLHQVYWHYAGLTVETGPIVTDNLNPKRLQEDIIKFASLEKSKANRVADLKVLFAELETLNTARNRCLHWTWRAATISPVEMPLAGRVSYELTRPLYKQSGPPGQSFSIEDIKKFCNDLSWLAYRLRSHSGSDDILRQKRAEIAGMTALAPDIELADLFWPAPWLKSLPPAAA
jgi:hypothetical protein